MTMELHNKMRMDPSLIELAKVSELLMIFIVSFIFSLFQYCYFLFFLFGSVSCQSYI